MTINKTYIWNIKQKISNGCISIGIQNASIQNINRNLWDNYEVRYVYCPYGYANAWTGNFRDDLPCASKDGDIITIKLKFGTSKTTLCAQINNKKEFIIYDNILRREGLSYRLAISLGSKKLSMQLIS